MSTATATHPAAPATQDAILEQAHAFLRLLHTEAGRPGFTRRWRNVRAEAAATDPSTAATTGHAEPTCPHAAARPAAYQRVAPSTAVATSPDNT
ncbi:hypothetical protein [Micromonospora sp. NPDC051141]|uniref:hypothetical protein n=1 Tax=Micromonospora sp. NPDC051141 TaxID=3364284 RepID=UPI00379DCC0F